MWIYNGVEFKDEDIGKNTGFVYLIINKTSGRMYVGKKLFFFTRTKTVKGKKKREKIPSDWKTYWSSSNEVQNDVKQFGESNFERHILYLCETKGTMSYLEAREQFDRRVLEKPEAWYNGIIQCRIHRSHVKLKSEE